ncbi:hypothetical protein F3Y22_tig00112249pilonHSYRG00352 [Hibiscus syriacus]|uniref:TIR domain-containing protein n=1 Tax=Hibiscus syriacus TaxID=106335 RepID=A0A6A2X3T3_HIBSY|nr:hypothetical protein F3Y22_tig00112249pilonHSYRG00352 [Hibiscus syriacus]
MASSVNFSSCQFNSFLYRSPRLKYSSFPSRQLKCFHSPPRSSRQLKYSFSPCRQLKYPFSPSRQLKYFSSPSCQLKDSSPSSLQLKDSSSSRQWKYQVFLSFRFETRRNFTSQLLKALKDTGMNVFFDEEKLEKGEQFLGQLTQSIEVSNLSIIILSADYASSDVCLTELSQIMDLKHNQGHIVLPIFFHVDPSDVQNISGTFQKSFDAHEPKQPPPCDEEKLKQWKLKQQKVKQWKADLAQVGTLKGVHIKGDRPETEHIKHIVECAINKLMKHQVFLSFGEDTRHNFSSHLLKALEDTGINVISDDKTEIEISQAIAASNLSIVVLSEDYAVSESCLAQLSCIMARQRTQKHIFLPIFYHVKPDELKLGRSENFAEVADLQGLIIEGGYSDRPDTEHIKVVVRDVIQKLNRKSRSVSDELIGIDDQKETILRLIGQEKNRLIGLWGMGGIGKTTLVDAVYNEITLVFDSRCFVHNVRRQIEDKGMISVRNELLTNLLGNKTDIDTPSIGCLVTQDRLKNKRVFVVLDDVNDSDLMDLMGVKYFGEGSKIIVTSRDRQVLKNGGADEIYKVKKLNDKDSLQLFSRFAFKLSNPALDFQDLWNKFLEYAQGNPLALKVLGSKLYTKSRKEWEGEVDKLKEYPQQKISQILRSSFDELDKLEKDIFLDIACFFKRELKEDVEEILSCLYKGAACGISNLLDKCLVHIDSYGRICMHDMLEEMGKDYILQRYEHPEERNRLWSLKDVNQVLRCNKENKSIKGIKFQMTQSDPLLSCRHGFVNMLNLRYIDLSTGCLMYEKDKVLAHKVDSVSFPDELRYLCWSGYPFKSLSSNSNPKNLTVLKLRFGCMEQLWNEDHQDLVNLRIIDLSHCLKLRKIPNLSGAVNLKSLCCRMCESLVELPCLSHLPSLEILDLTDCVNLRKIPNLSGAINLKSLNLSSCLELVEPLELPINITQLNLSHTVIKEVADSIQHLVGLRELNLSHSRVKNVSNSISKFESLRVLVLDYCKSLKTLPELPRYLWFLDASNCTSLEKVSFTDVSFNPFHSLHDGDGAPLREDVFMLFSNCRSLNQDSIKNIVANAMLQIHSLAQRWVRRKGISLGEYEWDFLFCCFPGNEVPENVFYYGSMNYSFDLKITPNGFSGSRLLAFAICLVADLTRAKRDLEFICKYQLTTTSGEKFTNECHVSLTQDKIFRYKTDSNPYLWNFNFMGDHVFILFNQDMIIIDNDYEKASFELDIGDLDGDEFKVKKCGVNIFYMDAEGYTISDVMRWDKSNQNSDCQEDANIEGAHDGSATEIRPGDERRFGNDGEEGDGGPKTLK